MFAFWQVSRVISLTLARADNVVASHLRTSDVVSLMGLRLALERQVGVCLETRKAEIKARRCRLLNILLTVSVP